MTLRILYGVWFPGNQERKYFAKLGDSASNLFPIIFSDIVVVYSTIYSIIIQYIQYKHLIFYKMVVSINGGIQK